MHSIGACHPFRKRLLAELCGVELSRGTIGRARSEINAAVESATISAQEYVQQQPVVNVDETGFKQYNGDGQNPGKKRGWLWVVVTPLVSFFTVALSRSQATAQAILGNYTGLVGSDRCPSYGWLENDHRQVCWAHLLRDFQAMAERSGASCEIGTSLLHKGYRLFHWWHRVRDGTMSRELFIEATNLRPAVIWRNTSFGSQSQGGSEFVSRMLTVSSSLKAQSRSVLDFLTQSCQASRLGTTPPTLIPMSEPTLSNERIILL